jgi:hypothetical protein
MFPCHLTLSSYPVNSSSCSLHVLLDRPFAPCSPSPSTSHLPRCHPPLLPYSALHDHALFHVLPLLPILFSLHSTISTNHVFFVLFLQNLPDVSQQYGINQACVLPVAYGNAELGTADPSCPPLTSSFVNPIAILLRNNNFLQSSLTVLYFCFLFFR